jgi:RNA polymerase sigma factor (sigma-70 family)
MQEVLLRIWKHLHKVPTAQVRSSAWACTTSKHIALDFIRRQQRESRHLDRNYHVDISSTTNEYDPYRIWQFPDSDNIESRLDLQQSLENAIRVLSLPQKQALLMVAEGSSYLDVASAQNTNVGTVKSRVHTARQRLRQELNR